MGDSEERQQVVLAEGVEGDVADHDHLVVVHVEGPDEVGGGVLVDAAAHLGVHAGHPCRGLLQAVTGGVLADGHQDLSDGGLDAAQVDLEAPGIGRRDVAHATPPSFAASEAAVTTRMSGRFRNRSLTSSP